ncbi:hypothetical protein [Phenylobacterium deserti]|uniref:hypothetical protein n=1 Tax=Phenylobacterium deserti TaxID=1914756 RepID=UPI001403F44D|nr:hypothetical protein [Phenylobacterium deserti]
MSPGLKIAVILLVLCVATVIAWVRTAPPKDAETCVRYGGAWEDGRCLWAEAD